MILPAVLATYFLLHVGNTDEVTSGDTLSHRRIIGGVRVTPDNKYPFMASVLVTTTSCGGSIIADRWILTAAHCVKDVSANEISVFTGDNHYDSGELHQVYHVLAHSDYDVDMDIGSNDIALLHLYTTITTGIPIELATADTPINTKCTIIGWGKTQADDPDSFSSALREADVCTTSCENITSHLKQFNKTSVLCTSTKRGIGACVGDSGSPLVIGNVQIGLLSNVQPCAVGEPDEFTNVVFFQEWIHNTMRNYD